MSRLDAIAVFLSLAGLAGWIACTSTVRWTAPDGTPREVSGHWRSEPGDHGQCAAMVSTCQRDSDCREREGGVCDCRCGAHPSTCSAACHYAECRQDSDCGTQQACVPAPWSGDVVALCVAASCRFNADCAAGGTCRLFEPRSGDGRSVIACASASDCATCSAAEECWPDPASGRARCQPALTITPPP